MTTESRFAQWLRREMVSRGYPLEGPRAGGITRLAADAGISQATMSRTVGGQQGPSLDTLRKLGDLFGIEIAQMMAHAGLAEYTRAAPDSETTEADLADRRSRFESIDGGKRDPRDYSETDFYNDIVAEPMRVPPFPPLGWGQGTERREKRIWAADLTVEDDLPAHWEWVTKWIAVQRIRDLFAQKQAEETAREAREAEQQRHRSNGA